MATFDNLPDAECQALKASLRAGEYNLFLGAGISLDSTNPTGESLPSGEGLRARLCEVADISAKSTLQRAAAGLTPAQIEVELSRRFSKCNAGPSIRRLPSFLWKRIFTLNIDDTLDSVYRLAGNIQRAEFYHFRDPYSETRSLDAVPVIHLHGRAVEPGRGYVFDRSAYASIMAESNAWMTVLADVMPAEPFFVIGTSLDEVDVAYYLAKRSSETQRSDRGPSFLVEPFPDKQTYRECERHGLRLFEGTAEQFFSALNDLVPERPGAYDLVPKRTRDLFPERASPTLVVSFAEDFERVPSAAPVAGQGTQFAKGHPPEWSDLARNWDVGRALSARLRPMADAMLARQLPERTVVVLESPGTGKTTVLRRVAYDLSSSGKVVLLASSISRLDANLIAEALDLIDDPVVIILDNIADQATQMKAIFEAAFKKDFIVVAAERSYRQRHLVRALGDLSYKVIDGLELREAEATQLVSSYVHRGIAGASMATKAPERFAKELVSDPIAVASCKILNDMEPLDRIASSTYSVAQQNERIRYLCASIAQFCFSSGARYEIIQAAADRRGWHDQFTPAHPLPLDHFDSRRDFVVPLNATLAERTIEIAPEDDVLLAFKRLSAGLAARVNRRSIMNRTPEARLVGRLFDYDDVVSKFLRNHAADFYVSVQREWQWNSRYWEQIALYKLSRARIEKSADLLQEAVQHARHAVAVENHPHPMTTLGKVLLAQLGQPGISNGATYSEAHNILINAISIERTRSRINVHAFITLFRGAHALIQKGGYPAEQEVLELEELLESTKIYFPRDIELREVADQLTGDL